MSFIKKEYIFIYPTSFIWSLISTVPKLDDQIFPTIIGVFLLKYDYEHVSILAALLKIGWLLMHSQKQFVFAIDVSNPNFELTNIFIEATFLQTT